MDASLLPRLIGMLLLLLQRGDHIGSQSTVEENSNGQIQLALRNHQSNDFKLEMMKALGLQLDEIRQQLGLQQLQQQQQMAELRQHLHQVTETRLESVESAVANISQLLEQTLVSIIQRMYWCTFCHAHVLQHK